MGCVDVLGRAGDESTLRKRTEVDIFVEDGGAGGAEGVTRVKAHEIIFGQELGARGSDDGEELHYKNSIILLRAFRRDPSDLLTV